MSATMKFYKRLRSGEVDVLRIKITEKPRHKLDKNKLPYRRVAIAMASGRGYSRTV